MSLKLLRAVVIRIGKDDEDPGLEGQLGEVAIFTTQSIRIDGKFAGRVFIASIPVSIELQAEDPIVIPDQARHRLEATLETVARLLAIDRQAEHAISSPMPFVGFSCDNPSVLAQLEDHVVMHKAMSGRQGASTRLGLFSEIDPKLLFDRLDGVALLAEGINSSTDTPLRASLSAGSGTAH